MSFVKHYNRELNKKRKKRKKRKIGLVFRNPPEIPCLVSKPPKPEVLAGGCGGHQDSQGMQAAQAALTGLEGGIENRCSQGSKDDESIKPGTREGTAVRFQGTGVGFKQGVTPAPHIRARQPWVSSAYGHVGEFCHNIL